MRVALFNIIIIVVGMAYQLEFLPNWLAIIFIIGTGLSLMSDYFDKKRI